MGGNDNKSLCSDVQLLSYTYLTYYIVLEYNIILLQPIVARIELLIRSKAHRCDRVRK